MLSTSRDDSRPRPLAQRQSPILTESLYIWVVCDPRSYSLAAPDITNTHVHCSRMSLIKLVPYFWHSRPDFAIQLIRTEVALYEAIVEFLIQEEKKKIEYQRALAQYQQQQDERRRTRRPRSVWVRPYLQRRRDVGHYDNLMRELSLEGPVLYRSFTRLDEALFDEIVLRVTPILEKKTTFWREPLPVGLRVAVTLRFLATGESYKSLGYSFRVAPNTISVFVPPTCLAIINAYKDEVLQLPRTPEQWKKVAKLFEDRWHFPHTLGAIDGKHVRIRNPRLAGSHYYNYKRYYSIVLLALVDADYKFLFVDVGAVGSEGDAGIFAHSRLSRLFQAMQANIPPPEPLNLAPDAPPMEYFMVGDDAFALTSWMLKPFPSRGLTREDRIFNYRLSRARRVVENAFGILSNR